MRLLNRERRRNDGTGKLADWFRALRQAKILPDASVSWSPPRGCRVRRWLVQARLGCLQRGRQMSAEPGCRHDQRLPPTEVNLVDRASARPAKPTVITATITPAIRPYSRAVTARRSALMASQRIPKFIIISLMDYL